MSQNPIPILRATVLGFRVYIWYQGMSSFMNGRAVANRSDFLRHLKKLRPAFLTFRVQGLGVRVQGSVGLPKNLGSLLVFGIVKHNQDSTAGLY